MSEVKALRHIVLRSRLLSVGLALIGAACFAPMIEMSESTSASSKPALESGVLKVASDVKVKFTAPDVFDPAFYSEADKLRLRLQSSDAETAQALQKQLTVLVEMQRRIEGVRAQTPLVLTELEALLGQAGPLNRRLIRPDSPFVALSAALERIRGDFQSVQAKKTSDPLRVLSASIKSLLEARAKLNDPGLAEQLNDRRKQIIARVDGLTVVKRGKEWELALQSGASVVAEILRLADSMSSAQKSVIPSVEGLGLDQGMVARLVGLLGMIFLAGSIWEVRRCDRRVLETVDLASVDSVLNNANRFQALQKAQEALPYLQLSAKQIADLTKQLMAAIQGLGMSVSGLDGLAEHPVASAESKVMLETQGRAREILRAMAMAKEQGIRLSLAIAQAGAEARLSDLGDRLAESMEHIDSLVRELQQDVDRAVADRMSSGPSPTDSASAVIKRDSEGVLLVAGQWSRQFERLNDALADLERLLVLAATTSPQGELSGKQTGTEPGFDFDRNAS